MPRFVRSPYHRHYNVAAPEFTNTTSRSEIPEHCHHTRRKSTEFLNGTTVLNTIDTSSLVFKQTQYILAPTTHVEKQKLKTRLFDALDITATLTTTKFQVSI